MAEEDAPKRALFVLGKAIRSKAFPRLSANERLVLTVLALREGMAFRPSWTDLEHDTNLSRSTIGNVLRSLEAGGWLTRDTRPKEITTYTIALSKLEPYAAGWSACVDAKRGAKSNGKRHQCIHCTSAAAVLVQPSNSTSANGSTHLVQQPHSTSAADGPSGSETGSDQQDRRQGERARVRATPTPSGVPDGDGEIPEWLSANGIPALESDEGLDVLDWIRDRRGKGLRRSSWRDDWARWRDNEYEHRRGPAIRPAPPPYVPVEPEPEREPEVCPSSITDPGGVAFANRWLAKVSRSELPAEDFIRSHAGETRNDWTSVYGTELLARIHAGTGRRSAPVQNGGGYMPILKRRRAELIAEIDANRGIDPEGEEAIA